MGPEARFFDLIRQLVSQGALPQNPPMDIRIPLRQQLAAGQNGPIDALHLRQPSTGHQMEALLWQHTLAHGLFADMLHIRQIVHRHHLIPVFGPELPKQLRGFPGNRNDFLRFPVGDLVMPGFFPGCPVAEQ